MSDRPAIRAEAERLRAAFEDAGAEVFETEVLHPAGALLDLYGEDIRARAFTVMDPVRGEMMLRPDFTLPLVRSHMANGTGAAAYTYSGEVFRRQEDDPDRASEYLQVGFELLGGPSRAEADARVFAAISGLLAPLGLTPVTGDIALLRAAVTGLSTSPARRAALVHHLWRPHRFRRLLSRFASPVAAPTVKPRGREIGKRSRAEVEARLAALAEDARTPPLPGGEVRAVETLLAVRGTAARALDDLSRLARDFPAVAGAVEGFAQRLDALDAAGVDPSTLPFDAGHGRATLEYYDGFVFSFEAPGRDDLPPVATGGRYDALTRAIGGGEGVPAVGGVIRPGLTLALAEGRA